MIETINIGEIQIPSTLRSTIDTGVLAGLQRKYPDSVAITPCDTCPLKDTSPRGGLCNNKDGIVFMGGKALCPINQRPITASQKQK